MNKKHARDFTKSPHTTIVDEWFDGGVKAVIVACRGSHFTAYLGVPKSHPLAKITSYDDLPLKVHGGLTYASGSSQLLDNNFFWWGWDYAHLGDLIYFDDNIAREFLGDSGGEHDWTLEEVKEEVKDAIYDFKKFVKMAESLLEEPPNQELT
jgi:hypothetical protein